VNNTSGFLADESGSRRFMITKLSHIDRAYQQLERDQIWAQAKELYFGGEQWWLEPEEAAAQRAMNTRYEVDSVLDDWLDKYFFFSPSYTDAFTLADIIRAMETDNVRITGSERSQAMELSRILTKKGARREHTRDGNRWFGIQEKLRS